MYKNIKILLLTLSLSFSSSYTHAGMGNNILGAFAMVGGVVLGYQWGQIAEKELPLHQILTQSSNQPSFLKKLDQLTVEPQGQRTLGIVALSSIVVSYILGIPVGLGLGLGLGSGYIQGRVTQEEKSLSSKIENKVNSWAKTIQRGLEDLEKEFKTK